MISRRNLLQLGLAAGTTGLLTSTSARAVFAAPTDAAADAAAARYTRPLTVPPVLAPISRDATTDHYRIVTGTGRAELLAGVRTDVLTYNGTVPGPTIVARRGRRVCVEQVNTLGTPTSMHLHGGSNPQADDGGTMDVMIPPGGRRTYTYENQQRAATLYMHDHTHELESEQNYRGLSGQYLVTDPAEDSLRLPAGRFDVPLVLRDADLDANGQLVYQLDDPVGRSTVLVNGRAWPRMAVSGRRYRFRIVNASNLRFFTLQLGAGDAITQIGSDGGLLPAPVTSNGVLITPGERADIVIDFSRYAPGTKVVLNNLVIGLGPTETVGLMRFDVGAAVSDPSRVPGTLVPMPAAPAPTVDRSFVLQMGDASAPPSNGRVVRVTDPSAMVAPMSGSGTINGKTYDPDRIDTDIVHGTTERWTVTNTGTIPHNFHTHLVQFRVLDRDGAAPTGGETGWKDTVPVFSGETVRLLVTFDSYRGVYPYHCHLIDHSAMGMMAQLKVT